MSNAVDELQIQISAEAESAEHSINNLCDTLLSLQKRLLGIDPSNMGDIGRQGNITEKRLKAMQTVLTGTVRASKSLNLSKTIKSDGLSNLTKDGKNLAEVFKNVRSNLSLDGLDFSELENMLGKANVSLSKYADQEEKAVLTGRAHGRSWENIQYNIAKSLNDIISLTDALEKARSAANDIPINIHRADSAVSEEGDIQRTKSIPESSFNYSTDAMRQVFGDSFADIKNYDDMVRRTGQNIGDVFKNAGINVDDFEQRLQNLRVPEINLTDIKKLQSELDKTEEKINRLLTKQDNDVTMGVNTDSTSFKNLQRQIIETSKYADALQEKIRSIGQTGGGSGLSSNVTSLGSAIKEFSVGDIFKNIKKSFSGVLTTFQRFEKGIADTLRNIKKSTGKSQQAGAGRSGISLGRMLGTSLLFSSVFQAISAIKEAIKEGSDNLVQYASEYNKSISSMVSSLTTLKNAFAAGFSPIVTVVAPYISSFINMISRALNALGQFFAALTGRSYVYQAVHVMEDYASTIEDAGGAAKDAQKNINNMLGIDELNVISPDKDSGSGGVSPGDMFETVPVADEVQAFADKIKDILEKLFEPMRLAWEREGQYVIDSWKYALGEIGVLAKDISRDFLIMWDQAETVNIFADILHIVGDIGTSVGNLAHNFDEAWTANKNGLSILTGVRNIIGAIASSIRTAADYTVEWSSRLNFSPLLESFASLLSSLLPVAQNVSGILSVFYTNVLLPLGQWTIEKGLPDLLAAFTDFANKIDWNALRDNLTSLWQGLEPFAESVGEGLIIFMERLSDLLAGALNSDALMGILDGIGGWMATVQPEDIADGITKLVTAFVALKAVTAGFDIFTSSATAIGGVKTEFSEWSSVSGVLSGNLTSVLSLISPLSVALTALAAGLGLVFATNEEVRQGFTDAAGTITSSLQPAVQLLADVISSAWGGLMDVLSPVVDLLGNTFVSIWQDMINPALSYTGNTIIPQLVDTFENLWNGVLAPFGGFLVDTLGPAVSFLADVFGSLWQNAVVPLADTIGGVLATAWESLITIVNGVVIPVTEDIISVLQYLWNNVGEPIADWIEGVFGPIFSSTFASIGGLIEGFGTILSGLIDFVTGIFMGDWSMAWGGVQEIFGGIWDGITGFLEGLPAQMLEFGKNIVQGLIDGIISFKDNAVDAIGEIGSNIVSWFKEKLGIHSPSTVFEENGRFIVEGLNRGIVNAESQDVVAQWIQSIQEQFNPERWLMVFDGIKTAFMQKWNEMIEWFNSTALPEFWATMSTTTFSVESWTTLFNNIPVAFQTKWNQTSTWWTGTAMPKFWKSAQDWFSNKRWTTLLEQVRLAFETKWTEIEKLLGDTMLRINQNFLTQIQIMQKNWNSIMDGMENYFISTFDAIESDAASTMDSIISKVNSAISAINDLKAAMASVGGGVSVGLNVRGFASGGFPEMGELFVANEAGPEFVGSIGSRTAVANNDQIVQGIAAGVRDAIASVIVPYLNDLVASNQEIAEKDTSIQLDGRELISGLDARRARNGFSFSG